MPRDRLRKKSKIKEQVCDSVLRALRKDADDAELGDQRELKASLMHHFERLPTRYALEMHESSFSNVLMHQELLEKAAHTNDPVIRVRTVESLVWTDDDQDAVLSPSPPDGPSSRDRLPSRLHPAPAFGSSPNLAILNRWSSKQSLENMGSQEGGSFGNQSWDGSYAGDNEQWLLLHEITIAGRDQPHRLTTLSAAVCDVGLNVREAHVFSTMDGFLLDIFVTDQLPGMATEMMQEVLLEAVEMRIEAEKDERRVDAGKGGTNQSGQSSDRGFVMELGTEERTTSGLGGRLGNFEDWEMDPSKLEIGPRLAGGSFADLHKGEYCGQEVAVKLLRTSPMHGCNATGTSTLHEEFVQEVSILRKVRHKNVVQFIGVCTSGSDANQLCIVTEFMEGGSLYEHLMRRHSKGFSPLVAVKVGIDVARGMDYLHKMGIVHRDLKASNLLIDNHGVVKVADFGVSRVKDDKGIMTAETGTYRWMAPEVIEHRGYDTSVDVFSFAITLWELLTAKVPYNHLTPLQAAVGVVQKRLRPELPANCPPAVAAFIQMCWEQDPAKRPNFAIIIEKLQQLYDVMTHAMSEKDAAALVKSELSTAYQPRVEEKAKTPRKSSFFATLRKLV